MLVFMIVSIIVVTILFYYVINKKEKCPNCKSVNFETTGNHRYCESPYLAAYGSPDSYKEYECRCNDCNYIFWLAKKTIIFN